VNEQNPAPLRDVAANPNAFTTYLKSHQSSLLDSEDSLAVLAREARVHCRNTRVDGDRWYHPRMRSAQVEKSMRRVLKHLEAAAAEMEKATAARHAFEEDVRTLPGKRRQKALEKARKKGAVPAQAVNSTTMPQSPRYTSPASVFDLGKESA
jgi:hypothetical protein